jgi:hypothetical protein
MRAQIFFGLCFIIAAANAQAAESSSSAAETELRQVLRVLELPQQPNSHIEHPGWRDPEARTRLKQIVEKYPASEQSLTAQFWLGLITVEEGKPIVTNRAQRAEVMQVAIDHFSQVINKSPGSWQAKLAGIWKCVALYGARRWEEFRLETGNILASIPKYRDETNPEYLAILRANRMENSGIEPELRWMLIVAAACEDKTAEAIAVAEELQAKFPDWSKERRVAGTIERLKAGKKAFGCR